MDEVYAVKVVTHTTMMTTSISSVAIKYKIKNSQADERRGRTIVFPQQNIISNTHSNRHTISRLRF